MKSGLADQGRVAEALFLIVVQIAVFKDHLHRDAALVASVGDAAHLVEHQVPIPGLDGGYVGHIIHLASALFDGVYGLKHLHLRGALSQGEGNGRIDEHLGAFQDLLGQGDGARC